MGEWVTVYQTGNAINAGLAESILAQENIPCFVKNRDLQNLFGIGGLGAGYNLVIGPVSVHTEARFADQARSLLDDLIRSEAEDKPESIEEYEGDAEGDGATLRKSQFFEHAAWFFTYAWLAGSFVVFNGLFGGPLLLSAFILCGAGFAVFRIVLNIFGRQYLQFLRSQGYEWPAIRHANRILLQLGRKAYHLPPAADIETLPDYRRSCNGIIEIVRRIQEHKRRD